MPTPSDGPVAAVDDGRKAAPEEALARSVLYAAAAAGLRRPDAESLGRLLSPGGRWALAAAAQLVDPAGLTLPPAVGQLGTGTPAALPELRARHDALFGHTARGPVCAFETEYGAGDAFRQPQELAHIAGYYRAFGLRPRREGERVDHIACECEFMALLAGREGLLLEPAAKDAEVPGAGDEQVQTTRRAARDFLRGHLGRFGLAFSFRLAKEDGDGFFGTLAGVLVGLLRCDAARLEVALGPPTLDLRPPAADAVPMACGSCPGLSALQGPGGGEP